MQGIQEYRPVTARGFVEVTGERRVCAPDHGPLYGGSTRVGARASIGVEPGYRVV